jgi:hypothetical protein
MFIFRFCFLEKIHLIDIYLRVILLMINPNQQCLMWNFSVLFHFFAQLLVFKIYNERLQDKK